MFHSTESDEVAPVAVAEAVAQPPFAASVDVGMETVPLAITAAKFPLAGVPVIDVVLMTGFVSGSPVSDACPVPPCATGSAEERCVLVT